MSEATNPKHVIDTHRHLVGPRLRDRMVSQGMYDPEKPLPQANEIDLFFYRDFVDLGTPASPVV
jgi:hypothetical protein